MTELVEGMAGDAMDALVVTTVDDVACKFISSVKGVPDGDERDRAIFFGKGT